MPKKRKEKNSLTVIREGIGLSQADFARRLGVSGSMIKKVEEGKRPLSHDLSSRIFAETGHLLLNDANLPILDTYSKEEHSAWLNEMRFTPKIAAIAARQAAKLVEWMLLAADRPGVQKSYQTFNAVIQALEHVKNEFRLEPHIDAVLRERQSTETRLYTVRELRANDLLARMVQFKDDPQLKDDDSLTLTKAVGQWPARELFTIWWQHRDVVAEILNTPGAALTDEAKARFHATAEQIEQAVDQAVEPFLPPNTAR